MDEGHQKVKISATTMVLLYTKKVETDRGIKV